MNAAGSKHIHMVGSAEILYRLRNLCQYDGDCCYNVDHIDTLKTSIFPSKNKERWTLMAPRMA